MSKRILIVGGGLAGTITANGLCRQLGSALGKGEVSITMLGTTDQHMYQPGLLYIPFGTMREDELFRDQRKVLDRRVNFFVDPASNIDVENNRVETHAGMSFGYDYLVIATGSRIVPEEIPGMAEGAHWFYDLDGARKMRQALEDFDGGKIVVNVNAPHKCPVAPLEISFMLYHHLQKRGLADKTEITYTYPIGRLHALEPVAHWTSAEFDKYGIKSETFFNAKSVDPAAKTIESEEGSTLPYDLLVTIPPHRGAEVIEASDLGAGGWVPTDRHSLNREGSSNVFVVGDTTNIPISKAGSTAHYEADTLIDNLTSLVLEGRTARPYDGKVFCFVETGMDSATYVWFNYETPPNPGPPSKMIHWSKLAYNRLYWLSARGLL
ncbi:MAG: NAD(P)/FAD-dependent oxidoreductase [Rhodospirillaceae bacterium]|jgi:sulfide:quinone oxidoreductase|nr:NAD(P)/FAD-dependent oxidoreductase [Rhodospirillaceae bacterium]MBT3627696.1 NAD(P)/FAD-dependent oxidoreductase [Rhodospirillaceae bacterium]MBT3928228.1 NAD(P)/FAD-dependent oxidoreductase [Rhodospirillaceae bacterium]MBT4425294.1 NAD(P)/FAD-dependent oxidoreductase [Rhodospirillaceae bacterium]MBT5039517.1 NAD(P)/FAD-dependent oxidoreductase [Rhodospirillaceae bacterium]